MKSKAFEPVPLEVQDKFWSYVDKSGGEEACWLWLSQRMPTGHPRFRFQTYEILASRFAFSVDVSPLSADARLIRHCDNPVCVNPSHFRIEEHEERVCVVCGRVYWINAWRVRQGASRFCGVPCRREWYSRPERLWEHVDKSAGCWIWMGPTDGSGYGVVSYKGRNRRAHRVAWELTHGPIPTGLWVLHECDVRRCCRPSHLYAGTVQDNNQDRDVRGRHVALKGEANARSALTEEQAREILALCRQGGKTFTSIGQQFGVGRTCVSSIAHRRSWKHLD